MSNLRDIAMSVKAWPFEEARRVLKRYEQKPQKKVTFCLKRGTARRDCPI